MYMSVFVPMWRTIDTCMFSSRPGKHEDLTRCKVLLTVCTGTNYTTDEMKAEDIFNVKSVQSLDRLGFVGT